MKSISKIILYVISLLAVVSALYVIFTPGSMDAENPWSPDKGPVNLIIWVTIISLVLAIIIFLIYKVVDIFKHPSHTKEAIYVSGAILIAVIIGFIFSGSGDIVYGNGDVYPGGTISKLIGTGLIATLLLFVVGVVFMVIDTVKGLFKS